MKKSNTYFKTLMKRIDEDFEKELNALDNTAGEPDAELEDGEADALGIGDTGDDSEGDTDTESDDMVTVTISKSTVEALRDLLQAIDSEGAGESEDDFGLEDETAPEGDETEGEESEGEESEGEESDEDDFSLEDEDEESETEDEE